MRIPGPVTVGLLMAVVVALCGCGKQEGALETKKPSFGQSFNTIEGVSGSSYLLDGYSSFVESKSGAFSPNAVLIVGVKGGVDLGGKTFDYGCIVVVEGTTAAPTFRLATPDDRIVLTSEVTVFGKKHGKGRFVVPVGGKITREDSTLNSRETEDGGLEEKAAALARETDWKTFVADLSRRLGDEVSRSRYESINSAFHGMAMTFRGKIKEIVREPEDEEEARVVLEMPSVPLPVGDGFAPELDSLWVSPEDSQWSTWERVAVGDTVLFTTTLDKGDYPYGSAMSGGVLTVVRMNLTNQKGENKTVVGALVSTKGGICHGRVTNR
jgi:hypothetical protein